MRLKRNLLTLALTFVALSVNAAEGDLVCIRRMGHAVTSIVIHSDGQFRLVDQWHGAFPTESKTTGKASGGLTNTDGQLNGKFTFTAFDLPSKLTVIASEGILLVGDDSPMRNFACVVE